jgi:hypothetical protein
MAKTVDQFSTIEDFRLKHNELAIDVGDKSGLRTTNSTTVVDALNSLEDKSFFFQEFIYTASAGQTTFTGNDEFANSLLMRKNKIQVYKNADLILEDTDYTITSLDSKGNYLSLALTSGASVNDKIVIYSFTGSYLGAEGGDARPGQFTETAAETIYNVNTNGVILNGDGSPYQTLSLESGYTIQLAGATYGEENLTLAAGKTLAAPTITDNTLSVNSGNITSGVSGTFSGALTAGSFTDGIMTATGGDITGVDDITGTANSVFTALQFIDKSGANLTGGVLTAGSLDISGNADVDGTMEADAYTVDTIPLNEYISDTVGAMVSSNTESGISVDYQDSDNTLDFNVADPTLTFTGDVAGSGQIVNLGNVSIGLTIQPDSVALGTDTTGNYVATIVDAGNDHITVANSGTETAGITLNITDDAVGSDQIAPNAVALGTQTTGAYAATVVGTENEITVSGSGGETAAITVSLPDDVTIGNDLTVTGDLTVNGDTTAISTTNLEITDKLIVLGKGSSTLAQTDSAGIQLGENASAPTITWDNGNARLSINKGLYSSVGFTGNVTGDATGNAGTVTNGVYTTGTQTIGGAKTFSSSIVGALTGNADTATTLATARTIAGNSFNGSANIAIAVEDLSNFSSTGASTGQALVWDGGAGEWEPTTLGSTTDSYTEGTNNKYFTDDRVNDILVLQDGLKKVYVDNPDGGADTPIDGRATLSLDYETVSVAPTVVGSTATGHLWFVI